MGIGERTGNTPLEAMCIEYASLRGNTGGMDLTVITEIAEYFEKVMKIEIPARTPFVGKNFNATKAGIHADGMLKNPEIYNIFDTEKILNRPPGVIIDAFSGLAGVAFWVNNFFSLADDEKIDKQSEVVLKMKNDIDEEYANGRTTSMSDSELKKMLKKHDPKLYSKLTEEK